MKLPECNFSTYIFVVTGMSYITDSSGTSKVVKAHEEIFTQHGIGYVVMFPISRSRGQGVEWKCQTTGCYGLVIDGTFAGVFTAREVLNTLLDLQEDGKRCIGVLIHHIIRNDLHEIKAIVSRIRRVPVVYYLHDFYTCCINPNMLKNDSISCVNGGVSSKGCVYYEKRKAHLQSIHDFFEPLKKRLLFAAPSEYVKNRWVRYYPEYKDKVRVIPHQKGVGKYSGNKEPIEESDPVRIGFVGAQKHIKGWDIFKKIVSALRDKGYNYKYYYFGNAVEQLPDVTNVQVDIATMGKDAMIQALRKNEIAVVFLVSIWGETYSYTMYEAHAANSFILTMQSSGNIAYTVEHEKWGQVFGSEEELIMDLTKEDSFRNTVNEWRSNAIPGAETYEDNDEIVKLFPVKHNGEIAWITRRENLTQQIKRAVLNEIFKLTRMRKNE